MQQSKYKEDILLKAEIVICGCVCVCACVLKTVNLYSGFLDDTLTLNVQVIEE